MVGIVDNNSGLLDIDHISYYQRGPFVHAMIPGGLDVKWDEEAMSPYVNRKEEGGVVHRYCFDNPDSLGIRYGVGVSQGICSTMEFAPHNSIGFEIYTFSVWRMKTGKLCENWKSAHLISTLRPKGSVIACSLCQYIPLSLLGVIYEGNLAETDKTCQTRDYSCWIGA